jgi:hypothetical protein
MRVISAAQFCDQHLALFYCFSTIGLHIVVPAYLGTFYDRPCRPSSITTNLHRMPGGRVLVVIHPSKASKVRSARSTDSADSNARQEGKMLLPKPSTKYSDYLAYPAEPDTQLCLRQVQSWFLLLRCTGVRKIPFIPRASYFRAQRIDGRAIECESVSYSLTEQL